LPATFTSITYRVCRSSKVAIWLLPLPKTARASVDQ
jgi:hypothetical protein